MEFIDGIKVSDVEAIRKLGLDLKEVSDIFLFLNFIFVFFKILF